MTKIKYQKSRLFIFILTVLAISACKKAENYYEKLHDQPEIQPNYGKVYGVGDTLTITGRLNPENNLVVNIGGVSAKITELGHIPAPGSETVQLDRIKIILTKEMGIGINRPVVITSAGNTIQCPAIEIIESSASGVLPSSLKLVKQLDLPAGAVLLFCQNGKGSIYLWKTDKSINKISKDGTITKVLDASTLVDSYGNFTIVTFNSGGVDPQERYLYFSALTTDDSADNISNQIYRVCRYDLQTKSLETLNRTLLPKTASQKILPVFLPFEGAIGSVKIMAATGFYPDSKGNIYIRIGTYAMAKIGVDKSLKYLFKFFNQPLPEIWDNVQNSLYSEDYINSIIPGVIANVVPSSVAPDEALMYGTPRAGAQDFIQYDLANQVETYRLSGTKRYFAPMFGEGKPYISGSFPILTGEYDLSNPPGLFGFMPLPGEKVLILYYQGLGDYPDRRYYSQYPAFGTLNYTEKRGGRYAPGKLERNDYEMLKADKMLNYDEEGMVYMTANQNKVIVKTHFQ